MLLESDDTTPYTGPHMDHTTPDNVRPDSSPGQCQGQYCEIFTTLLMRCGETRKLIHCFIFPCLDTIQPQN